MSQYVLITPARNAARHIERVLHSMQRQKKPPLRWIVVNDGSTDSTREILRIFEERCPFLEVLDVSPQEQRNFASKVFAFRRGYERLQGLDYTYIGNLDADMSFEPDYFERLLQKFEDNPALGIASGIYEDELPDGATSPSNTPNDYCPGALQLFRRECFEAIGGYPPLRVGGIDTAAVLMAKMKGWTVQSFPELRTVHHGRKEMTLSQLLKTRSREGVRDYGLGMHPLYALAKTFKRLLFERPVLIGPLARMWGYAKAWLGRYERELPPELLDYIKREEMKRLRGMMPILRPILRRN